MATSKTGITGTTSASFIIGTPGSLISELNPEETVTGVGADLVVAGGTTTETGVGGTLFLRGGFSEDGYGTPDGYGNIALHCETAYVASWNSGEKIAFVKNAEVVPIGNPTDGGYLYSEGGALKWRGTSGTVTTMAPADPHCPRCGRDFAVEWKNGNGALSICMWCLVGALEKAGIPEEMYIIGKEDG